jgi:hypothetical protein
VGVTALCHTRAVRTRRRAIEWTIAVGLLGLFIFVPVLRDHRRAITTAYLAVLATVGVVRGRPEGIRFLVLSTLVPLLAIALAGLALWVNIWLGLAFIVIVPTTALLVADRRDRRTAMH